MALAGPRLEIGYCLSLLLWWILLCFKIKGSLKVRLRLLVFGFGAWASEPSKGGEVPYGIRCCCCCCCLLVVAGLVLVLVLDLDDDVAFRFRVVVIHSGGEDILRLVVALLFLFLEELTLVDRLLFEIVSLVVRFGA